MGIQGLLRNLHPLLVPPPSHNSHGHSQNDGNNQQHQSSKNKNKTPIRHNICQFAHKSLAIDASSWLHKAGYACAERLVESSEQNVRDPIAENTYTSYMVNRCADLLNHAKIGSIFLVFDGMRVPLKSVTNKDRETKRQANLAEARRLAAQGRKSDAADKYRTCVKGTAEMAHVVCKEVEKKWGTGPDAKVKCVFSPYEADAQLAKLCLDGYTHAVVTEDSDVLVYSAVCRKPFPIIYKLDRNNGACDVLTMDWLVNPDFLPSFKNQRRRRQRDVYGKASNSNRSNETKSNEDKHCSKVEYDDVGFAPIRRQLPETGSMKPGDKRGRQQKCSSGESAGASPAFLSNLRAFVNKEASNPGSGVRLFVQACVLSGCDYIPNRLHKVGPVTAFKLVKENSHRDPALLFEKVLRGTTIVAEASIDKSSDNGDDDFSGEVDGFSSPPSSDIDSKENYEELLTRSEAVFYYHLVKSLSDGEIVPLLHHNGLNSNEIDESCDQSFKFYPAVDRFGFELSFIGSVQEATRKLSESRVIKAASDQKNTSQWMSAVRSHNSTSSTTRQSAIGINKPKRKLPPKETPLQKFLKGPIIPKSDIDMSDIIKSVTSTSTSNNVSRTGSLNPDTSSRVLITECNNNPFASFSLTTGEQSYNKKNTLNHSQRNDRNTSVVGKSPFFSPLQSACVFDYGDTDLDHSKLPDQIERNSHDERDTRSNPFLITERQGVREEHDAHAHDINNKGNKQNEEEVTSVTSEAQEATRSTLDEIEIIPESPPIKSVPLGSSASKYFTQSEKENGSLRRVSTSPMACSNAKAGRKSAGHNTSVGSSPDDAIELLDDDDERRPLERIEANHLFTHGRNLKVQSVNKRPFKSPYANHKLNQIKKGHKKSRATSSSAILAGFARQKQMAARSVAGDPKTQTRKFSTGQMRRPLTTKRPKGTPSLKSFYQRQQL